GFLTGAIGEKAFLGSAKGDTPKQTREQECEAYFYAGTLRDIAGDEAKALEYFKACVETGVSNYIEYETSSTILKR
ncbi:MAG: hypothetical protein ACE5FA_14725, partial [Dehalococcoidia bacterium]